MMRATAIFVLVLAAGCGFNPHKNYLDLPDGGSDVVVGVGTEGADAWKSSLPDAGPDSVEKRDDGFDTVLGKDSVSDVAPLRPEAGPELPVQPDARIAPDTSPDLLAAAPDVVDASPMPVLVANPASVDFGSVMVGESSGVVTITVTNVGTAPTEPGALLIQYYSAWSYRMPDVRVLERSPQCENPIAPGSACVFQVQFTSIVGNSSGYGTAAKPGTGTLHVDDAHGIWGITIPVRTTVITPDAAPPDTRHCGWTRALTVFNERLGCDAERSEYWRACPGTSFYGCCYSCPPDGVDAGTGG